MYAKLLGAFSILGAIALFAGCASSDDDGASATGGGDAAGGDGGAKAGGDTGGTGGTDSDGSGGAGGEIQCPTFICDDATDFCASCNEPVEGIPHVLAALAATQAGDSNSAELRFEDGAVCMSGTSAGWAMLGLALVDFAPEPITAGFLCTTEGALGGANPQLFDAAALGIERLQLTIDSPPSSGVTVGIVGVVEDDPASTEDCLAGRSFYMMDGWNMMTVAESGTTVESALSDFIIAEWEQEPTLELDPTQLNMIRITLEGEAGDFDFCVRDVRFLDANGDEVL